MGEITAICTAIRALLWRSCTAAGVVRGFLPCKRLHELGHGANQSCNAGVGFNFDGRGYGGRGGNGSRSGSIKNERAPSGKSELSCLIEVSEGVRVGGVNVGTFNLEAQLNFPCEGSWLHCPKKGTALFIVRETPFIYEIGGDTQELPIESFQILEGVG
jgi:hypothetical protein